MLTYSIMLLMVAGLSQQLAYEPRRMKQRHQKQFGLERKFRKEKRGIGVFNLIVGTLILLSSVLLLNESLRLPVAITFISGLLLFDSAVEWRTWRKHPYFALSQLVDLTNEANFFKLYPEGARANRYIIARHTSLSTLQDLKAIAIYNQKLSEIVKLSQLIDQVNPTELESAESYIQKEAEKAMEQLRNEIRYQQNQWLKTHVDENKKKIIDEDTQGSPIETLKTHLQKQGRLLEEEKPKEKPKGSPEAQLIGVNELERIIFDSEVPEDVRSFAVKTLNELQESKENEMKEQEEEWKRMDSISVIEAVRKTHGLEGRNSYEKDEDGCE